MTSATDPPIRRIPFNALFSMEIGFHRTTKYIVWSGVVTNDRPKLSYDTIVLENWEKSSELLISTMVRYRTKRKEGLRVLLLTTINKVGAYPQKKKPVWGSPDIKREVNTRYC